jgi:hypothetical protein
MSSTRVDNIRFAFYIVIDRNVEGGLDSVRLLKELKKHSSRNGVRPQKSVGEVKEMV